MTINTQANIDKEQFKDFERHVQREWLDPWYEDAGWSINRSGACREYDLMLNGEKVEEKIRNCDRDDILVEVIQDLKTFAPGWAIETRCKYLHYVFAPNREVKRVLRIEWNPFKDWWFKYLAVNKFGSYIISPRGWGLTLNLVVPIPVIQEDIYTAYKFNGYQGDNCTVTRHDGYTQQSF